MQRCFVAPYPLSMNVVIPLAVMISRQYVCCFTFGNKLRKTASWVIILCRCCRTFERTIDISSSLNASSEFLFMRLFFSEEIYALNIVFYVAWVQNIFYREPFSPFIDKKILNICLGFFSRSWCASTSYSSSLSDRLASVGDFRYKAAASVTHGSLSYNAQTKAETSHHSLSFCRIRPPRRYPPWTSQGMLTKSKINV